MDEESDRAVDVERKKFHLDDYCVFRASAVVVLLLSSRPCDLNAPLISTLAPESTLRGITTAKKIIRKSPIESPRK